MNKEYRHKTTSVSMINYHLVFCPRYRRKIFLIEGVEEFFKEQVRLICERNDFELIALECQIDHCHIFINVPPDISAAKAVQIIKSNTSREMRLKFPQLSSVRIWTRSYFASTAGAVSMETVKRYVEGQKKRPD